MKNAHEFRNMYICPKPDGSKYYQTGCRTNTCQNCQNLKLLDTCICLNPLPDVKWSRLESFTYTTKNGEERSKKDFKEVTTPFNQLKEDFIDFWPDFLKHHHIQMWQTDQIGGYAWQCVWW